MRALSLKRRIQKRRLSRVSAARETTKKAPAAQPIGASDFSDGRTRNVHQNVHQKD